MNIIRRCYYERFLMFSYVVVTIVGRLAEPRINDTPLYRLLESGRIAPGALGSLGGLGDLGAYCFMYIFKSKIDRGFKFYRRFTYSSSLILLQLRQNQWTGTNSISVFWILTLSGYILKNKKDIRLKTSKGITNSISHISIESRRNQWTGTNHNCILCT